MQNCFENKYNFAVFLTHWGRVTHICVGKLSIIGSDNGSSPGRRQAIIWTNAVILLVGHLGTNFSENWNGIETFSIKEMHLKMSFAKWRLFGLGLNELNYWTMKTKDMATAGMVSTYFHNNITVNWRTQASTLLTLCEGNLVTGGFSPQSASNVDPSCFLCF